MKNLFLFITLLISSELTYAERRLPNMAIERTCDVCDEFTLYAWTTELKGIDFPDFIKRDKLLWLQGENKDYYAKFNNNVLALSGKRLQKGKDYQVDLESVCELFPKVKGEYFLLFRYYANTNGEQFQILETQPIYLRLNGEDRNCIEYYFKPLVG